MLFYVYKPKLAGFSLTHSQSTIQPRTRSRFKANVVFRALGVLSAVLFLIVSASTQAAVINASSVSLVAVQAAVNSASSGDTVQVPAGTATWTGALTIDTDIQLIGAGIGHTVITDGGSIALQLISWTTLSNHFDRISGFTFAGSGQALNSGSTGTITILGTCHAFQADHLQFIDTMDNADLMFDGWVYGVVDNCSFLRNGNFGVWIRHEYYGGYNFGDGSWADADHWGTTNALYVESCAFTNNYSSPGAIDAEDGARFVFRYNSVTNDNVGWHGTETGNRLRSARSYEIYGNNFYFDTNRNSIWFAAINNRGGTGVIFSNTFAGYNKVETLETFRATPDVGWPWPPWGVANGLNGWDANGTGIYDSGTATGPNGSSLLIDSTKSWAVNQWVTNNGAFVLWDTNQNVAAYIEANTATTLTLVIAHAGSSFVINNGDSYTIGLVYSVLDQPGRGPGDLLGDYGGGTYGKPYDTVTGKTNWPNQVLEPVMEWSNTLIGLIPNNSYQDYGVSDSPTIVSNRDFTVGTVKPGYTPLVYPHPLVSGTPAAPSYTLTVLNGTGSGTYNSNSVVTISTNATYSAEHFTYWSGSHIANTNSASTTVVMPATNLTVTANYIPLPPLGLEVMSGQ